MEAIAGTGPRVLIVEVPLRHGKSLLLSQYLTSWYLAHNPTKQIILASATQRLAERWSRRARGTFEHYAPLYYGPGVSKDRRSATDWQTTCGGGMLAAGIGSDIVGVDGNLLVLDDYCIAGGQRILTNRGLIPIEKVVIGDLVLTHKKRWRPVIETHRNGRNKTIEITAGGNRLRATPEHLVYTSDGWKEIQHAEEVYAYDLQELWKEFRAESPVENVLLAKMRGIVAAITKEEVPKLQEVVSTSKGDGPKVLLSRMRGILHAATRNVSRLWNRIFKTSGITEVLQYEMSTDGSLSSRERNPEIDTNTHCVKQWKACRDKESKLSARSLHGLVQSKVQEARTQDHCTRSDVLGVSFDCKPGRSSHGREQNKQRRLEPGNAVQFVPCKISSSRECEVEEVFDLTVEEDHSYTAEGVIVHNCRNAKDALSELVRDSQWEWFQSTFFARLEPGGSIIILCTRWHADDLIGRILDAETFPAFRRIKLPALAGLDDELGRQPGEALWPERWPIGPTTGRDMTPNADGHHVVGLSLRQRSLQPFWWLALYQQDPRAGLLAFWPPEYFRESLYTPVWPRTDQACCIGVDFAEGKTSGSDYAAVVAAAYSNGKIYIQAEANREPPEATIARAYQMAERLNCRLIVFEAQMMSSLVSGAIQREAVKQHAQHVHVQLIQQHDPKPLRIQRWGEYLHREQIAILDTPGGRMLGKQLEEFPNGRYDDVPDAGEIAIRFLPDAVKSVRGSESRVTA